MILRVKKDFKFAQNLELYFTIILSFIIFVLSIFNIVNQQIVNSLILAILSLLTIHILQERWLRQELMQKLSPQYTWDIIEKEMIDRLQWASKVKFMAISPLGILRKYSEALKEVLRRGEVQFIVVDPESRAMDLIKQGRPENYDDGKLFLEELCKNFAEYMRKGRLKVKLINYIPSHILTIIDEERTSGLIFATVYSFSQVDPHRPSEVITPKDARFSFFKNEFNTLWNDQNVSREFVCQGQPWQLSH